MKKSDENDEELKKSDENDKEKMIEEEKIWKSTDSDN